LVLVSFSSYRGLEPHVSYAYSFSIPPWHRRRIPYIGTTTLIFKNYNVF
jgi:hypothetical protein